MKKLKQNKKLNDYNRIFISKAKIGNLKAFKGENEIEFAPMINLIFGKNSSGKSTINQALRLFRQSYGFKKLTPHLVQCRLHLIIYQQGLLKI